jgi:urea transport system substrate-binding protein
VHCTIRAILASAIGVLEPKWGTHVRRNQTGPAVSASAQTVDGNGRASGPRDASTPILRRRSRDFGGQHNRSGRDRYRGDGRNPSLRDGHHGDLGKFIQEDGASDWPTFAEKAKKLLVNDKCAAVMGCWTSASRKAVLPVFEQYNGMLYYPTFYEGLEQSKNVIYTGQEATQQIIAGLDWVNKTKGAKTFYLLGSDYIWPRTSNKIARKHIEGHLTGGKVVGEEYFPLGSTQFNSVINKIKLTKPDVIYAIIVGGSNVAFYKQLKAAGIDLSKQTLLTISVTEDEIDGIGGENIAGAFACMKYFQSLDNPNNKAFVPAFKKMWGEKTVIGDVTQAAYLGPWLWKLTAEKAGSFDIDKIAAASPGVEFKGAPEGYVRIHENHHLWSKTRVGKAKLDGQYELVYETADLVEPDPFPKGYQ